MKNADLNMVRLVSRLVLMVFALLCVGPGMAMEEMTPTPTVTPVPLGMEPTPVPPGQPHAMVEELAGDDLSANQLVASPPAGFFSPKLSFGPIPDRPGSDGRGVRIDLAPGQGTLIISLEPIPVQGLARVSATFRADSQALTIALVALNSPIDGQIGYSNITGNEINTHAYRRLDLVYAPPSGVLHLGFQVVNMPFSSLSSTVYLDNLSVESLELPVGEPVSLVVPGDFDSGLKDLILNYNNVDGSVTPFFESITDVALRLAIQPENLAANFGTLVTGVDSLFPFSLLGEIRLQRDSVPGGGMVGFLLTNGNQNVAVFQSADALPHSSTGLYETLRVGGDFLSRNPDIPINVIVQNGGPDVTAAVIADDLYLRKYASFEPVPPTPTPIPIGQTIIIPLDLPEGAKPLEMVLISGGTFVMGSPNEEKDRGLDEGPQHLVTISQPFYMGKYEITQAQWKAVMGSNPSFWKGDNLPVEMVSWDDIQTFVQKINQLGEGTFRLPTEAEWEYACRAGTTSRYYWGDDLNYSQIIEYAWHRENSSSKTHEVGLMPPNTWELYDMSGNVWEWCQDWYGSSYYSQSVITDPTGPDSGINRVIRGGSWGSYAQYCRSALRYGWSLPSRRDNDGGFRLQRAYP